MCVFDVISFHFLDFPELFFTICNLTATRNDRHATSSSDLGVGDSFGGGNNGGSEIISWWMKKDFPLCCAESLKYLQFLDFWERVLNSSCMVRITFWRRAQGNVSESESHTFHQSIPNYTKPTQFLNFYQISEYLANFRIWKKIKNFDKTEFLPNLRISAIF